MGSRQRRRLLVFLACIQYAGSDMRSGSGLGPRQGGLPLRGCRRQDKCGLASRLAALRGGGDSPGDDGESGAEMSSGFENEREMVVPKRSPSIHAAAEQGRALALADPSKPLSLEVRRCYDQAANWGYEGANVTVVKLAAAEWHVKTAEGVEVRGPFELEEGSRGVLHRLRWGWRISSLEGPDVGINVLGGPWLLRQCKLRCCDTTVVQARGTANLTLDDCFIGGEGKGESADGPAEASDGLNAGGHAHVLATDCTFQVCPPPRRVLTRTHCTLRTCAPPAFPQLYDGFAPP